MKKIILVFSTVFVFMSGCQILSSDNTSSPEITIEPSPVISGQEVKVTISHSQEFIMPDCGGITYEIEKLESEHWTVIDGHYGPCNTMMLPETLISESISINFIIDEMGVYRFVSSFKYNSKGEFEPIFSNKFEVASIGIMPL